MWLSEWLAAGAVNVVVAIFRLGGRRGPAGRELAARILAAAGEAGVKVDETVLDSGFRLSFGQIDYQPQTGVLELTEDKARRASLSSAGLVTLEVGRALQYRRGFFLVYVQRAMAPFVNVAGFAWVWPGVGANVLPLLLPRFVTPQIAGLLYWASAAMLGLVGFYVLLKIPLELDAAARGARAMAAAGAFSTAEEVAIYIFLAVILGLTLLGTLIIALNIFRSTVRKG